ncbi:hypothetical protein LDG_5555 [Legionella drancourtii LLAP12]|uniref:Uncharacterized protein n=1 Tax=Legionella drancourtii LLAP12 TaxID=658187 RepID=G9EK33_9GAMM|nr:hypothetical protein LDG_5555 [Legionella drancourtii LLAP12]
MKYIFPYHVRSFFTPQTKDENVFHFIYNGYPFFKIFSNLM